MPRRHAGTFTHRLRTIRGEFPGLILVIDCVLEGPCSQAPERYFFSACQLVTQISWYAPVQTPLIICQPPPRPFASVAFQCCSPQVPIRSNSTVLPLKRPFLTVPEPLLSEKLPDRKSTRLNSSHR